MDNQKKLYRSNTDKMIAGIAGGLGEYISVDSTIIRVIFVILFFITGFFPFLLLYIVLAFVIPMAPRVKKEDQEII